MVIKYNIDTRKVEINKDEFENEIIFADQVLKAIEGRKSRVIEMKNRLKKMQSQFKKNIKASIPAAESARIEENILAIVKGIKNGLQAFMRSII